MQYLLMLYVNEAGWPKLSKAEQEQGQNTGAGWTIRRFERAAWQLLLD